MEAGRRRPVLRKAASRQQQALHFLSPPVACWILAKQLGRRSMGDGCFQSGMLRSLAFFFVRSCGKTIDVSGQLRQISSQLEQDVLARAVRRLRSNRKQAAGSSALAANPRHRSGFAGPSRSPLYASPARIPCVGVADAVSFDCETIAPSVCRGALPT